MKKIIEPFILTLTNFFQIVSIFSPYVLLFIISIYSIFTNKIISKKMNLKYAYYSVLKFVISFMYNLFFHKINDLKL